MVQWSLSTLTLLLLTISVSTSSAEGERSCSFYCFATPEKHARINVSIYEQLNCTHFVYGYATVTRHNRLKHSSFYDMGTGAEAGNYRAFARMKLYKKVELLLGIYQKGRLTFIDDESSRSHFATLIIDTARKEHFDGLFFNFDVDNHRSFAFESFLQTLTAKVDKDAFSSGKKRLFLVLAIPTKRVNSVYSKLKTIEKYFDAIYLISDEISGSDDPHVSLQLQPLYPFGSVPPDDTISENAVKLVKGGVNATKIIIGLSTWARSYIIRSASNVGHRSAAQDFGELGQCDHCGHGRISYAKICRILKKNKIVYDQKALTLSITDADGLWYSFELPNSDSFSRKLQWIASHGFGGVGISSVEGDDVDGVCGEGPLPIHHYALRQAKCAKSRISQIPCNRICVVNPDRAETPLKFNSIKKNWCTHIVISSAEMQLGTVKYSEKAIAALLEYHLWDLDEKPQLILAVGGDQTSAVWRAELAHSAAINALGNNIKHLVKNHNADGVAVSWTAQPMQSFSDKLLLSSFVEHLRLVFGNSTLIMINIHPKSFFNGFYDISVIQRSVDYIILDGHRFHGAQEMLISHQAAMFSNSELLKDRRMSLESFAFDWVSRGVPNSKLILGLSAEGLRQYLSKASNGGEAIGASSDMQTVEKTPVSQSAICELKNENGTKFKFDDDLGVPYLHNEKQVVTYDDENSAHIKAVWASLNNYGGVAVHGIELDNTEGTCPPNESFPILRAVVESQVCKECPTEVSNSTCHSGMRVTCSYRLPDGNDNDPLRPQDIPFDKCTEIVVEEALINGDMDLRHRDGTAENYMSILAQLLTKTGGAVFISSVRCQMTREQFTQILQKTNSLVDRLIKHVEKYGFNGIELKCDHILTPENKDLFTKLINDLTTRMKALNKPGKCPRTLSIRIPAWKRDLHQRYNISQLNSLHHVVLEPFEARSSAHSTPLASPLFPLTSKEGDLSIAGTIKSWVSDGLHPSSILLHISTYGVSYRLVNPVENKIGDAVRRRSQMILRQKQMCRKNREFGYRERTSLASVTAYATTTSGEWITYETQETILAKVRYAIREKLAGVGLMTLNEDDFRNACSHGVFPLLAKVTEARNTCQSMML